jgi:hypothetical protein
MPTSTPNGGGGVSVVVQLEQSMTYISARSAPAGTFLLPRCGLLLLLDLDGLIFRNTTSAGALGLSGANTPAALECYELGGC